MSLTQGVAGLPLQALRAFDAAARHLNMARAAAELGVTQGAISRQIKALEDRLRSRSSWISQTRMVRCSASC